MTEFDFKGALVDAMEPAYDLGDLEQKRPEIQSALRHCARVQSGELVVVPREADANMRCAFLACDTHYMASMEHRINEHYKALIQAAPKHDWSEE